VSAATSGPDHARKASSLRCPRGGLRSAPFIFATPASRHLNGDGANRDAQNFLGGAWVQQCIRTQPVSGTAARASAHAHRILQFASGAV